jgi:hypothetical protein
MRFARQKVRTAHHAVGSYHEQRAYASKLRGGVARDEEVQRLAVFVILGIAFFNLPM